MPLSWRIYVLAGVNGAGKSSIGGAIFRNRGADYYNADEVAHRIFQRHPGLDASSTNSLAWRKGKALLEKAIREKLDYTFETTLGGETMTRLLIQAAEEGCQLMVWYAGLMSPELHIQRVRSRVRAGGHAIAEEVIRRRWDRSRLNLIRLLPHIHHLRMFDNSIEADPRQGKMPRPELVLEYTKGKIVAPDDLTATPDYAKPVVASALKLVGPGLA